MRHLLFKVLALFIVSTISLKSDELKPKQNQRANDIAFVEKISVSKKNDISLISFTVSQATDVEVTILDANQKPIRHLAAGVLGADAITPPLKNGLKQSIEWDGKDDYGNTAKGSPFKVRVRAGSTFEFGRFIGDDPYNFGSVDGLTCDENGNLYISSSGGTHNQSARTLRVYDNQGRYIKEIMPFPANLSPDTMKGVAKWDDIAKSWRPVSKSCLVPEIYGASNITLVSSSLKNGVFFADRNDVYVLNADGSIKGDSFGTKQQPWVIFDATNANNNHYGHPWHYQSGTVCYSASPDGKWLYLTGPVPEPKNPARKKEDPRFPLGGVYRMRLDGKDKMQLFVSLPATYDGPWSKPGGANYGSGSSGPIHFVGCDSENNVYVPDRETNRVVVFSEAGKQIGEFAVKNPHQIVVNPKTGAIYVLRKVVNGWGTHAIAIEKFNSFGADSKSIAIFDKIDPKSSPKIAVSASKDKTIVWLAGTPTGLIALEDKGESLTPIENHFKRSAEPQVDWNRLSVDYANDEVYVADGGNMIWRYDGKTGKGGILKDKKGQVFPAVDLAVGHDGLLYVRTGTGFSGPLERFTRDLEPANYASGTNILSSSIYSRYGIGNCEKGLAVGPKGEVYISFMYDWTLYAIGGFDGEGKALPGHYLKGLFPSNDPVKLKGYPTDLRSSVIGPITSAGGGIRVDLAGNIYVGLDVKKEGYKTPSYFANDEVGKRWTSSVVKFGPKGGTILGLKHSESQQPDAPKIALENKLIAENALNIYSGLGPVSGAGPGGNSSCCVCRVPRFDVDRFGRIAIPSSFSANVLYYDNAGNLISNIGCYGNFDSQFINTTNENGQKGKPSVEGVEIPLTWPSGAGFSENHIYINDTYARRVVRVDKKYKLENIVEIK